MAVTLAQWDRDLAIYPERSSGRQLSFALIIQNESLLKDLTSSRRAEEVKNWNQDSADGR
jgi:hypothetical protein